MVAGAVLLTGGPRRSWAPSTSTRRFTLVSLYLVIIGAGVGMLMQNLVLAVQNTLDVREIGSGTSTVAFFRTLGGALGVSALGVVLSHRVTDLHGPRPRRRSASTRPRWAPSGALPDLSTLPENVRIVVEQSFGNAIADLFLVAAPVALISLIAVLFLKEVPLGTARASSSSWSRRARRSRRRQAGVRPTSTPSSTRSTREQRSRPRS